MPATDELGRSGEDLIALWIPTKGGRVLAQRWHCVIGEIDIIALNRSGDLIFIEVKTRSSHNIDQDGVLAVTRSKQIKLWKTAQLFLVKNPKHQSRNCRFDIALVQWQPVQNQPVQSQPAHYPKTKRLSGFTRTFEKHEFILINYLVHAFEQPML
ncbi:MAG: YraN family protein [Alkalinema sp. CAN_BIN05]|nr:YraN family protein [Alkalinema sp. CAN_BIN05]